MHVWDSAGPPRVARNCEDIRYLGGKRAAISRDDCGQAVRERIWATPRLNAATGGRIGGHGSSFRVLDISCTYDTVADLRVGLGWFPDDGFSHGDRTETGLTPLADDDRQLTAPAVRFDRNREVKSRWGVRSLAGDEQILNSHRVPYPVVENPVGSGPVVFAGGRRSSAVVGR